MIVEFTQPKLEPMTKVSLALIPGQPTETETGFVFPFVLPSTDGKQISVAAIDCTLSETENGVLRIAVNAVPYTNGEAGEASLLNYILVDLKQFVAPTNESEVNLSPPTNTPNPKAKS